jgi:hypothetical protein
MEDQTKLSRQTRGIRGIFLGFNAIHKRYIIYCPGSRNIITAEDAIFNKHFSSAIALTWQQHRDSLGTMAHSQQFTHNHGHHREYRRTNRLTNSWRGRERIWHQRFHHTIGNFKRHNTPGPRIIHHRQEWQSRGVNQDQEAQLQIY